MQELNQDTVLSLIYLYQHCSWFKYLQLGIHPKSWTNHCPSASFPFINWYWLLVLTEVKAHGSVQTTSMLKGLQCISEPHFPPCFPLQCLVNSAGTAYYIQTVKWKFCQWCAQQCYKAYLSRQAFENQRQEWLGKFHLINWWHVILFYWTSSGSFFFLH